MKAAFATLAIGLAGAAGWIAFAAAGSAVMPSYLAGWLLVFGIPAGALLLVLGQEALGYVSWSALPVLRRTVLLLPAVSVFSIPVLLRTEPLYRRPGLADALPPGWAAPGRFDLRMVIILLVLSGFALVFSRTPSRPRRLLAVIGCMLHICLVSVAAVDWVMSLQPGLNSSAIGLLLISSELGTACCLLAFVLAVQSRERLRSQGLPLLLTAVLAAWGFLHFIQFLIVWSADLPTEIVWYQARSGGWGGFAVWFAAAALALGLAILPSSIARVPAVLASVSAMLLLAHLVETLWLVTPAFRGRFSVTLPDALALIGLGGLTVGLMIVLLPRTPPAVRHAS